MINSFDLKNLSLLEEIHFGQDFDCDFIYEDGGLDWGNVPATHNTYNYPNQVGDSISSSKINNRDITITAYSFYILSEDEKIEVGRENWYKYCYEKIKEKNEILNRVINPLNYVRLTIGDYYIEGKPSATPKYGTTVSDNNLYFCKFMISIFCANPMFKKITQTTSLLSGDLGAFFFPLFIPSYGKIMGVRNNYLMLEVDNEGNAEIGGIITITAKGEVVNPVIENFNTGEQFRIYYTMQQGDIITINTSDGGEKGIWGTINGITSSFIKYMSFSASTWLKFKAGRTILVYSTDNQSEEELDIKVELNPQKYGLEDM